MDTYASSTVPSSHQRPTAVEPSSPQLDLIWNVTSVCGWDCAACCVAALHVKQKNGTVLISTPQLDGYEEIAADPSHGNVFDQALQHLQAQGRELSLAQKLTVLDNLEGHNIRLDVSGGDVLSPRENYKLLDAAATRLGKKNVSLTAMARVWRTMTSHRWQR